ncbi:MAG TPA: hypothetical protein VM557_09085 [Thermoanaerobaculia bacterium]|nr:hypothetical protein [Thermoanaerobaculia bacterium]
MSRLLNGDRTPATEILVASFERQDEAESLGKALAERGIAARVTTIVTPVISAQGASVPVRFGLAVTPADSRAALQLLQETLLPDTPHTFELEGDEPLEPPPARLRCPECGADQVKTYPMVLGAIASVTLLMAIGWSIGQEETFYLASAIVALLLLLGPNRRCLACGERWME